MMELRLSKKQSRRSSAQRELLFSKRGYLLKRVMPNCKTNSTILRKLSSLINNVMLKTSCKDSQMSTNKC